MTQASSWESGFGPDERSDAMQHFVERRLAEAEAALGLETPNKDLRDHLAFLLWKTLRNRKVARPKSAEIADRVNDIAAAFERLLEVPEAAVEIELISTGKLDPVTMQRLAAISYETSGGRPVDVESRAVLSDLWEVAHKITGRKSKYSYKAETDTYSGALFLLVRAFKEAETRALGAPVAPQDDAIAKEIERFARRVKEATKPLA